MQKVPGHAGAYNEKPKSTAQIAQITQIKHKKAKLMDMQTTGKRDRTGRTVPANSNDDFFCA